MGLIDRCLVGMYSEHGMGIYIYIYLPVCACMQFYSWGIFNMMYTPQVEWVWFEYRLMMLQFIRTEKGGTRKHSKGNGKREREGGGERERPLSLDLSLDFSRVI